MWVQEAVEKERLWGKKRTAEELKLAQIGVDVINCYQSQLEEILGDLFFVADKKLK